MQIKTRELEGVALDWAVAVIGLGDRPDRHERAELRVLAGLSPSTNWGQGGPLIERYKAEFRLRMNEGFDCRIEIWDADGFGYDEIKQPGPTHLIAAMRAIVAAELGDVVDVPEELAA